eukprot:gnl/TRDRNA2_/TRDRNA2_163120_c1_seq1.p1 gnl/TRDRNA2_/TRDRNA2_163120_c1~~gnl/TRDRNA2_/TRDRNA2_163120_c1_seq1.p1  ORF type:complete len:191 (-),score=40.61 gnl/TRDRNA2_/TRDRNA2_163120_c1_seq1:16-588(-)
MQLSVARLQACGRSPAVGRHVLSLLCAKVECHAGSAAVGTYARSQRAANLPWTWGMRSAASAAGASKSSAVGSFRAKAKVGGITVVATPKDAKRVVKELKRLSALGRPHAWDTETAGLTVGMESPVNHGNVVCATCFCGDDVDFGSGPRLLVDNSGPAAGLLKKHFKSYFEDSSIKKIFHNYSFDRHMLR